MTTKVLIDCDPGIDDALAIALAHASTELDVVGLTTVAGNVSLEHTTNNALCLVDQYGMGDVPVVRGADRPLLRAERRNAAHVHGDNGLGNVELPATRSRAIDRHAVEFLIETVRAAPGEISVAAIGPLTNIALALRTEPRLVEWVREFVIMGGSYTRGNITPAAEFNIAADPEAAAIVFDASWRTVMIGLDLTRQARATSAVRERFAGFGRFRETLLDPCLDFYGANIPGGPPLHDTCAIAYLMAPELFTLEPARVVVETSGRWTSGMTVTDFDADPATVNAAVATGLATEDFWNRVADAFARVMVE